MSPEEVREWDERVSRLYRSRSIVQNVAAILMDTSVGASGDREDTALVKAEAILAHLRKRKLLGTTE